MSTQNEIENIIEQITELVVAGPMLPGTVNEQWTVCGKKTCRCANPDKPRRHGPYSQLSFTLGGKSSSIFIKASQLNNAEQYTRRYHEFKELSRRLAQAYVALVREQGFKALSESTHKR